jgi:radical SAM protein with 4Fe4S-binding SPASM domain
MSKQQQPTISLLYVYDPHDLELEQLLAWVNRTAQTELIILDDTGTYDLSSHGRIRAYAFPRVSKGFLYNRGVRLAAGEGILIIEDIRAFIVSPALSDTRRLFGHTGNGISGNTLGFRPDLPMLFPEPEALVRLTGMFRRNFFFNKTEYSEKGRIIGETVESLGALDQLLRGNKLKLGTAAGTPLLRNKDAYTIGAELCTLLSEHNISKYPLFASLLLHKSGLRSTVRWGIAAGMAGTHLRKKAYFAVRGLLAKTNREWIEICRRYRFSGVLPFPAELAIEPTNYCNASCPLCPTGSKQLKRAKGYMDFALFKKIIDECGWYLDRIFLWNLGEPFLHPDVYSMIQYAKRFGIRIVSSTNGYTLYTSSAINRLVDSGIDELVVSADGIDSDTFGMYRKGVNYGKLIDGLAFLKQRKTDLHRHQPIIHLQMILMSQTQNQIDKARMLAKSVDAKFLIKFLNLEMVRDSNKRRFLPETPEYSLYGRDGTATTLQRKMENVPCVAWDGMVINWDGTVNPCLFDYYSAIALGNVSQTPLDAIWRNRAFRTLRKRILSNKRDIAICRRCPINERFSELYYP